MSMYGPDVSRTSSQARGPSPLSSTCVRPAARGSKPSNDALQLLQRGALNVAVHRVAVRVNADPERPEVLHAELPEALGHELLPEHLFDLLNLRRLERCRAADEREID